MTPAEELAQIRKWKAEYQQRIAELESREAELLADQDVMRHARQDPGFQQYLLRKQLEKNHATETLDRRKR